LLKMTDAPHIERQEIAMRSLVVIESPYASQSKIWPIAFVQRWLNRRYARACMRHSILAGEAPIASHLLYTQPGILRDHVPEEREIGIEIGLQWGRIATGTAVYTDHGISPGMRRGIERAK
jgi:hypothetical protein